MGLTAWIVVHVLVAGLAHGYIHRRLVLQNLALRQQLGVYLRTVRRPRLRNTDRLLWTWLSRLWSEWSLHLVIVRPETVLKWHRRGFARFWAWKSRHTRRPGRPRIPQEHIELIRRMSRDNPAWGEDRIADELRLKCSIKHSPSTIRRYMVRLRNPDQGQSFRTFVKNHLGQIFACDFLVQHTAFFKAYYVFAVMELDRRRIVHFNITDHPSLSWVKQQIRQATWDQIPRFLIHDNDGIFGQHRLTVANEQTGRTRSYRCTLDAWLKEVMGITGVPTPYAAPNANAHIERWFLSLRVEALNHFIFTSQEHIRRVVTEYVDYYNRLRPSQAIHTIPDPDAELRQRPSSSGRLVVRAILRGLHHDYRMVA